MYQPMMKKQRLKTYVSPENEMREAAEGRIFHKKYGNRIESTNDQYSVKSKNDRAKYAQTSITSDNVEPKGKLQMRRIHSDTKNTTPVSSNSFLIFYREGYCYKEEEALALAQES